ncbi:hypothetical protein C3L33_06295, partial [Rhododendron williamsianum]
MADDDFISALPESVLVHILSFLPVQDAIKTEALSKRWQFLWTYLPSLLFRQDDYLTTNEEGFVAFVDKTLPVFSLSKLEKFGVDFFYEPRFAPNVNSWTRFAAGKGVEELYLEFDSDDLDEDERYELPQVLYTNSSFKRLGFSLCRVIPKGNVAWNSLKKLSIGYVKLSDGVIEKILAGSPVLEVLELCNYGGFSQEESDGEHGDSEEDDGEHDDSEEDEVDSEHNNERLEISAPYLRSLEISGCYRGIVS